MINPIDTVGQVFTANGSAAMQVAEVYYPLAVKGVSCIFQRQFHIHNLNPFAFSGVNIHRPGGAESHLAQRRPFEMTPAAGRNSFF